ncbi:MAG: hypothetical protein JRD04_06375 [Deltaproteobacteria bacterium]|nr:hypothetical protein [Deltaproteobacteria bacterium]
MPRIFDNIEQQLLTALCETLPLSSNADFCVGYFNLRGWKNLDSHIESWSDGEGNCCRLLVGMQRLPQDELRQALSVAGEKPGMDNQAALRLKKRLAEEFRDQLATGIPTSEDEAGLRRLAAQIKDKKVVVKLFLRYPLHAKLYLLFRPDPVNPITGFLGSSNLTFAGLSRQGELNIDILDHDACNKLAKWFEDRWNDRWCIDISEDLVKVIEESWAREDDIPPYHIYLKIAYHLAQEARAGLSEFSIPRDFGKKLFDYQTAAVKIAAHHLNKRGGVMIGDVVGLEKTLMATAVARIFEDDYGLETLVICPKNLVTMWDDYCAEYRLRAKIIPISQVQTKLPELRRYRIIQRAGRVDRIGQKAEEILCYSFLPAEGVEQIIRLRSRVRQRLRENAEVVGTDEAFFEGDGDGQAIVDLYNERSGILDGDADAEVDLASYAYQIWKNAVDAGPSLRKIIPQLPSVVYSSRKHQPTVERPEGVLIYMQTTDGHDALAWMDKDGKSVTESQFTILKAATCPADTLAVPRLKNHHELVGKGVALIVSEERSVGGQLGRPSGARFRTYERLKRFADEISGTIMEYQYGPDLLHKSIEDIYRFPLRQATTDTLNRHLRSGISDPALAELVIALREEDRLCIIHEDEETREPRLICSMGLIAEGEVEE